MWGLLEISDLLAPQCRVNAIGADAIALTCGEACRSAVALLNWAFQQLAPGGIRCYTNETFDPALEARFWGL